MSETPEQREQRYARRDAATKTFDALAAELEQHVTVPLITRAVDAIQAGADDPEGAHINEDRLYELVLSAIGAGTADDPAACAAAALKTADLEFPRWYA